MGFINDETTIDLECPGCHATTPKTIGWIKANGQYECTCGKTVKLEGWKEQLEKADESIQGLVDQIADIKRSSKWIK